MIPLVMPPLSNLRVLVTRPALQAQSLCDAIAAMGGESWSCPLLTIAPRITMPAKRRYDLVIFVSANAAIHGAQLLQSLEAPPQLAAIGQATAAALKTAGLEANIIAPPPFNSEALLQLEVLQAPPENILIVRGVGGRDVLRDTLMARGSNVEVVEVYERSPAVLDESTRATLSSALRDGAIDVITATSVEIAEVLCSLFSGEERECLERCAVVAGSRRIAMYLAAHHWRGDVIVSDSPDDAAMLHALTRWHARART
ncbi:MAG TPA: uroporphyrinogen-III synthase [Steroidobacteraceae bacterium]|nr:uroporphyrinogen-III synthase [Steroidobacteraceae bacterium]